GNAILGTLSNTQTTIDGTGCPASCAASAGKATATFTAGSTGLPGPPPQAHADVTVDGATVTANITIPLPPTIAKVFNPTSIPVTRTTSLQFTLTNPSVNTVAATGVAFTDTLPAGLTLASSTSTVCGGTLTTTAPTGIALAGATIAVSGSCQFSITVTRTT